MVKTCQPWRHSGLRYSCYRTIDKFPFLVITRTWFPQLLASQTGRLSFITLSTNELVCKVSESKGHRTLTRRSRQRSQARSDVPSCAMHGVYKQREGELRCLQPLRTWYVHSEKCGCEVWNRLAAVLPETVASRRDNRRWVANVCRPSSN
jgi:hypothetical protein